MFNTLKFRLRYAFKCSLLLSTVLLLLGANIVKVPPIEFCPSKAENEIRTRLKLGAVRSISDAQIFEIIRKNNYVVDEKVYMKPFKCNKEFNEKYFKSYGVYTGMSEDRTHLKDYLIVIGEEGYVTHIEARYSYPPWPMKRL